MAAAPSVNEEHMRRVRPPATGGEARTSSTVTGVRNWAMGLSDPLRRAFDGGGGDLLERRAAGFDLVRHPARVQPHEHAARLVGEGGAQLAPLVGGEPVLDARQGGSPVAGPHLLDAHDEDGRLAGQGGHDAEVHGRAIRPHRSCPRSRRRPNRDRASRQPRLGPHAALVEQATSQRVGGDHEPHLARAQPGVGQRFGYGLVRKCVGREVAAVEGRHADSYDAHDLAHEDLISTSA